MADTLWVSFIGYEHFSLLVSVAVGKDLLQSEKLASKEILLNEVIVSAKVTDAKKILVKAYNQISVNFPIAPYSYNGFLREEMDPK